MLDNPTTKTWAYSEALSFYQIWSCTNCYPHFADLLFKIQVKVFLIIILIVNEKH